MSRPMWIRVVVLGALLFTASGQLWANPPCGNFNCAPICPEHEDTFDYVQYGACTGAERVFRCWWECGCKSDWRYCWCPDCECVGVGQGCFLAGTPILMADGSTKPIEAVRQGDKVMAFDESAAATKVAPVGLVHSPRTVDHYYVVNGTIRVTATQPVLSKGTWVEVGKLAVGDVLTGSRGEPIPIFSIQRIDEKVTVYNFQVGSLSSYVAHGIIVHNKEFMEIYPCEDC